METLTVDNRDAAEMHRSNEARIEALQRALKNPVIPLADAMICLSCGSILRIGSKCCGDMSLLSAWCPGIEDHFADVGKMVGVGSGDQIGGAKCGD